MGDLHSSDEACDVLLNYILPQLHILSNKSTALGIFSDLWTLTDYITSTLIQFIDRIFNDVIRWLETSATICCNQVKRCACHCAHAILNVNRGNQVKRCASKLPVDSEFAIVQKNYCSGGNFSFLKGLISRLRRALHGSSDDIGWLQREPGMAPVEDGSARFLELLEHVRNGKHKLPRCFVYLLIPGLFSNHGPLYFVSTKRYFSKMGLACHIAKIHSEASVEHNALVLKQYIEELYWGSGGKRLMLLGHSKGGVDAAAALSIYHKDLVDKVAGLALVQSPYGGTPVVSDILREGQIADKETRSVLELIVCKIIKGDIRSLEDLTYEKRKVFIRKHKLPKTIPIISFNSEASGAPGVLSTVSLIAYAELLPCYNVEVPVVAPLSAFMALCSLHLKLRYGEKSDGLVTCRDAEVPGSVVIRPDRKLDHAWMVYTSWTRNLSGPNSSEMCEAILTQLVELGRSSKYRNSKLKMLV